MGASLMDGENECHMDAFDNCRESSQCRCVSAGGVWLQGVRRLQIGLVLVIRNDPGTVAVP
jgi:hypothetical protein